MSGLQPTLAGFTNFVRTNVGIGTNYLPDDSPWLTWAYNQALNIVNPMLKATWSQPGAYTPYTTAVYNLGTHTLIEMAQDVSYPIGAASWANGLVTLTLGTQNTVQPGDLVAVSGVSPVAYDSQPAKAFRLNSVIPGENQVTYALGSNPGPGTVLEGASLSETYFYAARASFGLLRFVPGVITNASDQGTGASLLNPEFMKNLTIADLQYLRTPWGQIYDSLAQKVGTLWGLT